MSAVGVVESLMKLATVVTDAAASNTKNGKFDFSSFLQGGAPAEITSAVSSIVGALTPNDIQDAINTVNAKQKALLDGKSLSELSTDKLVQYSALTDTKLTLSTALVKQAEKADFFLWLQNGGLGDLMKIAQVVIPLLI